ncbi:MAG: ATPase domain-containing protein [Dehalococcoidia bacterium]
MQRISTAMPALDAILDGGIPTGSSTMIIGPPGAGKTILSLNILFANASEESKALYFTTVSEPPTKLLRYQQEFAYFDKEKFNTSVIFVDIGSTIKQEDLAGTMEVIKHKVEEVNPRMLCIDSFKALADLVGDKLLFRRFVHDLSVLLAVYECTAFLVGDYSLRDLETESEFAIADGVICLDLYNKDTLSKETLSSRVLRVHKMRGTAFHEGDHSYTISDKGMAIFPRLQPPLREAPPKETLIGKVPTGIPGLDGMLNGGLNEGFSTMIAGAAGTGKTTFAVHFVHDGLKRGERCLLVGMEESPSAIVKVAAGYGVRLAKYIHSGQLTILHRRPPNLNVYQMAQEIRDIVTTQKIRRVAFDAMSDIQTNVAGARALHDYVSALVSLFESRGVTSLWTNVIENTFGEFKITEANLSVAVDSIILLRYVEVDSRIEKAISVLKMRGSNHDKTLRRYEISAKGIEIGGPFEGYGSLILGASTTRRETDTQSGYQQRVSERLRAGEETNPEAQGGIVELARKRHRRG